MDWFEKINRYFNSGLWSIEMVKNAVIKNKITEEEYKEIVGEDYNK